MRLSGRIARLAAVAAAVSAVIAVPAAPGCGGGAAASAAPVAEVLPVSVARAERRDVPLEIRAIGTVDSPSSVVLKPQVEGRLVEVRFHEGDEVKNGDVLLLLDSRPFEARLRLAEAALAHDTALAKDAALAAEQIEGVLDAELVSKRSAQQARAAADAAQATVAADAAAVDLARLQLEHCSIRAPFDGRTGMLSAHVGTVVKADETELVTLSQMAPVRVVFAVPQDQLPEIRRQQAGAPLGATASAPGGEPVAGRVTFIDNAVDSASGTIRLMASFDNADHGLWPGQYVEIALQVSVDRGVVVVPSRAVQVGQAGSFVFVVRDDDTVAQRAVQVQRAAGDATLIASGLQGGEAVVTDGQLRLVDGAHVEAGSAGGEPAAPGAARSGG